MDQNYHLDHDRSTRLGFPEVVYGGPKRVDTIIRIVENLLERSGNSLITRLQADKYEVLRKRFDPVFYDEVSGICVVGRYPVEPRYRQGVAVLSGGTSDEHAVNEAFHTLQFLGVETRRFQDIGAAGVHRLLNRQEEIAPYRILIVVAGFEGALPTVVGGIFPQPVIAVPADVGYGVAAGGQTALHSMLASCANGITVTNVDNGYGAALAAYRMLRSFYRE